MPDMYGNPTAADLYNNLLQSTDQRNWYDSVTKANNATANTNAQNAYYNAMANHYSQSDALGFAQLEWQKTMDTAQQTGMWNGQWSNPQEQWFTGQFGQWYGPGGAPTAGTPTQQAQQQAYQQAFNLSQAYGQYYAPGTTPIAGNLTSQQQQQQFQNAQQTAGLTGYYTPAHDYNVQPGDFKTQDAATRDWYLKYNQNDENAAAAKWAQDASASVKQFYAANPDYGKVETQQHQQQMWQQAFNQQQFQAQQAQLAQQNTQNYLQLLSNLRGPADWAKYQQVLGSTPQGMRDLYAAAMGQYMPGGGATTGVAPQAVDLGTMQQQVAGYNPQAQASGGQVWGSGIGVGGNQATGDQAQQATGNGTNMWGANLPAPNQISAQSWNNFTPSQQQMLLGQYEAAGWDKNDVQALYNQSLPKYGTNTSTAGTWRLQ